MTRNKKLVIAGIVSFIVIIAVLGILYGWFRPESKLSSENARQLSNVKKSNAPVENVKETFSKLWHDHVARTRNYILAMFNNWSDINEREKVLLQNQEDIGREVDKYYSGSGGLVTDLLKEHIVIAKDILQDLKHRRLGKLPKDINRWYDNSDRFSMAMKNINPKWDLKHHMRKHLRITEYEAIAEWLGMKKASENVYNKQIVPQAQEIASIISDSIAA